MKTIKPFKLGVLCRAHEHDHRQRFVVTIIAFFPFESPRRLLPEMGLWKVVAEELGKDAMLDACMNKLRGEVVVTGKCFTPGGTPRTASSVRVKLGAVDKTLYVVGDRTWTRGAPGDPAPFTEMPVTWERAFGGEGFPPNPVGRGAAPIKTDRGEVHPMPNVEDPKALVKSPRDRPVPSGLGAYDITWPQRASKMGTYDKAWMDERYPGFPADIDWTMWNASPPDQQIEGYFRGDEPFVIENMHPAKPKIESALPGLVARCFINQKTPEGEVFREIKTRIDTVHLFPHRERGVVLFRGIVPVREDDAADVLQLIVACEAMGATPKPVEHYKTVLAQRLDRTKPLLLLRDGDLMPALEPGEPPLTPEKLSDMEDLLARDQLIEKNMRRGAEKKLDAMRAEVRKAGLDPTPLVPAMPPLPVAPTLDELPEHVDAMMEQAQKKKSEAEEQRARAEKEARALCAENGVDYDKAVAEQQQKSGGPPKFSAKAEMEKLLDAQELARNAGVLLPHVEAKLSDPELPKKLLAVETQLNDAYRIIAHRLPSAASPADEQRRALREEVKMKVGAGISLEHRDLTGADLSGLDLHGADLSGAFLENANLKGADLSEANLTRAVLTRANLTDARMEKATLKEANLGEATLLGVRARGADCTGATLAKADFSGADFRGATLVKADLAEARFYDTDFSEVKASEMIMLSAKLVGAKLAGADLTKCAFLDAQVEGVDFTGARLTSALFLKAKGKGAIFRNVSAVNLRVVDGSSFAGADFQGADLGGANLRGTDLSGADFREAKLGGADLSECDLRAAKLGKAFAVEARFAKADLSAADLSRANLMEGILANAKVHGTNFQGANLFRADAARMRGDAATNLKGAHTKRVRIVPVRGQDGKD